MKRAHVSFWIATPCLVYWTAFYIFVFQDLYLTFDTAGFMFKMLLPVVLIANLVGVVLGLASWSEQRSRAILAGALNGLPIISILWLGWWLFFGVRI